MDPLIASNARDAGRWVMRGRPSRGGCEGHMEGGSLAEQGRKAQQVAA